MITIKEIAELVKSVKADISPEDRAFEDSEDPSIQLTVATTDLDTWAFQTGDNCYTGGAYGYDFWAVVGVYRSTNSRELAKYIIAELKERVAEAAYWKATG